MNVLRRYVVFSLKEQRICCIKLSLVEFPVTKEPRCNAPKVDRPFGQCRMCSHAHNDIIVLFCCTHSLARVAECRLPAVLDSGRRRSRGAYLLRVATLGPAVRAPLVFSSRTRTRSSFDSRSACTVRKQVLYMSVCVCVCGAQEPVHLRLDHRLDRLDHRTLLQDDWCAPLPFIRASSDPHYAWACQRAGTFCLPSPV